MIAIFFFLYSIHVRAVRGIESWTVPPEKEDLNYYSIDSLSRRSRIDVYNDSCMHGTDQYSHSPPHNVSRVLPGQRMLDGTTLWVNEHQAVGHAMYDISLLQVLHSTDVKRIVLQRAPCATPGLCQGIGTWESFFKAMYSSMLLSANKNEVPVFIRFEKNETAWQPYYVLDSVGNRVISREEKLKVEQTLCFDRVIRRHCDNCFYDSISPKTVRLFRSAANNYSSMVATKLPIFPELPTTKTSRQAQDIIITFAHRGNHTREQSDHSVLARALKKAFNNETVKVMNNGNIERYKVTVNILDTNTLWSSKAAEQIREFNKWQVSL